MVTADTIRENWLRIKDDIFETAISCGRNPKDISIITVSKKHPLHQIIHAYDAGARIFGENYAQECRDKILEAEQIHFFPEWHFIGSLQTNKAKYIVPKASLIHSVSSVQLAEELHKLSKKHQVTTSILVQVNTSGESSKSGVAPSETIDFVHALSIYDTLTVKGFMTLPTFTESHTQLASEFALLRNIRDNCSAMISGNYLSMGMSSDYKIAVQEGATHVRIGTAILGERISL